MGISLSPMIDDEILDHKFRKCDGKSLADYYLAFKTNEDESTQKMLGGLFGVEPSKSKIIRYDFQNKRAYKEDRGKISSNDNVKAAMRVIDSHIQNGDDYSNECKNDELENAVTVVKAWILELSGPYLGMMGNDVTEVKEGAIQDCDDILMAIKISKKNRSKVTLLLG
jgi:hypothetical protein